MNSCFLLVLKTTSFISSFVNCSLKCLAQLTTLCIPLRIGFLLPLNFTFCFSLSLCVCFAGFQIFLQKLGFVPHRHVFFFCWGLLLISSLGLFFMNFQEQNSDCVSEQFSFYLLFVSGGGSDCISITRFVVLQGLGISKKVIHLFVVCWFFYENLQFLI